MTFQFNPKTSVFVPLNNAQHESSIKPAALLGRLNSLKQEISQIPKDPELVRVFVGQEQYEFIIHKNLLCTQSKFFNNACMTIDPADANRHLFNLENEDQGVFQHAAEWMQTGNVAELDNALEVSGPLLLLYFFSEGYGIEGLKNWLVDRIRLLYHEKHLLCNVPIMEEMYKRGRHNSQLMKFFLHSYVWDLLGRREGRNKPNLNSIIWQLEDSRLMRDIIACMVEYRRQPFRKPSRLRGCQYHEHFLSIRCPAAIAEEAEANRSRNKLRRQALKKKKKAEEGKTEQMKAEQRKAEQGKAEEGKVEEDNVEEG